MEVKLLSSSDVMMTAGWTGTGRGIDGGGGGGGGCSWCSMT